MSDWDEFVQETDYESHPGFKFSTVGQVCKGTIVSEPRMVETEDIGTKKRTRKLVLDVETAEGTFSLWLPVGGKSISKAVVKACKDAGVPGPAKGGKIAVKYDSDGTPPQPGFNPPKLFKAQYEPPATTIDLDAEDAPF